MTRFAVIGLGYWGPNLVRNFQRLSKGELRLCCDLDPQRVEAIRRAYPGLAGAADAGEVFADPEIDAVAIATPPASHYSLARAALEAGKSVLVEKPLATSVAQAEELVELARKNGLVLMVDHVFIYSPAVRKIRELIESRQLGELRFVDSVRINLGLFQHDVNVVWDLATHDLSIVEYLLDRMPKSVAAFGAAHFDQGVEDVAYLNLDFGGSLIANFHLNWLSPVKIRYTMIGGSKKSVIYNDLKHAEKIKVYDSGIEVRNDDLEGRRRLLVDYRSGDVWSPHIRRNEPLQEVVQHFADCIAEGRTPITDGEAGLRIVRILAAAQHSIRAQGGRITL